MVFYKYIFLEPQNISKKILTQNQTNTENSYNMRHYKCQAFAVKFLLTEHIFKEHMETDLQWQEIVLTEQAHMKFQSLTQTCSKAN